MLSWHLAAGLGRGGLPGARLVRTRCLIGLAPGGGQLAAPGRLSSRRTRPAHLEDRYQRSQFILIWQAFLDS